MLYRRHRQSAFTLTELMFGVGILLLIIAVAYPNFTRARANSQKNTCIENLRSIDAAKQQWAIDLKKTSTATPLARDLVGPALYLKKVPACPAAGAYVINRVDKKPTCSIAGHTL